MHVLETPKQLVHRVLLVDLLQDVCADHSVQVGLCIEKGKYNFLHALSASELCQYGCNPIVSTSE